MKVRAFSSVNITLLEICLSCVQWVILLYDTGRCDGWILALLVIAYHVVTILCIPFNTSP